MGWLGINALPVLNPFIAAIIMVCVWIMAGFLSTIAYTALVSDKRRAMLEGRSVNDAKMEPAALVIFWPVPTMFTVIVSVVTVLDYIGNIAVEFGISIKR